MMEYLVQELFESVREFRLISASKTQNRSKEEASVWMSPFGAVTATERGATPALLQSTVKDWGILALTPDPTPGPEIFTLLASTTSFTGTLNGLPVGGGRRCTARRQGVEGRVGER